VVAERTVKRNPPLSDDRGGLRLLPSRFELLPIGRLICPTGCRATGLSSPLFKKIPFPNYPKSHLYRLPSCSTEGRLAIVTDAGRDAVDADSAIDERC
jgi:hypothetical protein